MGDVEHPLAPARGPPRGARPRPRGVVARPPTPGAAPRTGTEAPDSQAVSGGAGAWDPRLRSAQDRLEAAGLFPRRPRAADRARQPGLRVPGATLDKIGSA